MFLAIVWIELWLSAIVVWCAFVRANSYFSTPWLRLLFSVSAWFASAALLFAVGFYSRLPLRSIRPIHLIWEHVSILADGRNGLLATFAAAWLPISAGLLIFGLRQRKGAEVAEVPRARTWRWLPLFGSVFLLLAAIPIETEVVERRLHGEVRTIVADSRARREAVARPTSSIADEENAAVLYERAFSWLPPSEWSNSQWESNRVHGWDGSEVLPLTAEEEEAADLMVAAGMRPRCSFGEAVEKSDVSVPVELSWKLMALLRRRLLIADEPPAICDTLATMRNFSTHQCRDSVFHKAQSIADAESSFLLASATVLKHCPEKLSSFDRSELNRDDAEALLGGFEYAAASLELDRAEELLLLLESGGQEDGERRRPFDEHAGTTLRWAKRVRQAGNIGRIVDTYRLTSDRFRKSVAAAASQGYSDWSEWRDRNVTLQEGSGEDVSDGELNRMLARAFMPHFVLSARRVANTSLAAALFRLDRGRLPESIEELVPAYLPQVPVDAMFGRPIGLKVGKECIFVYAPDFPTGECRGLRDLERRTETRNLVGLAVRIDAPLPAGKSSAKLLDSTP